ncbi:PREDICTED: regulator of microtubule dynamics protein 3-like isoform X2 [Nicrophorus vespilloides]|uniref:Regulator of microtubule dynamics protein 1 n=1 Tax=Nicrophorus vespilloides TaxID=110193 RepID=A0ABM1N3H6_NICVS|nr:PREDICTED: regulator of microtubule dynamics protein 3-like isoform X2 [Nicrophorus vespilloides]
MPSSSGIQSPWFMLGAAVVGLVSAAGMILAEHLKQERKRHSMTQEMARMDKKISSLIGQVETLQRSQLEQKNCTKPKGKRRRHISMLSTTTTDDYASALELDSSDLEFYDISDEENSKASTITPLDNVLKEIDEKLDSGQKIYLEEAQSKLQNLCYEFPECPDLLWRIGKGMHKLCLLNDNVQEKMEIISKGLDACKQAYNLRSECGDTHKWIAILTGARSEHQGLRDKIRDSVEFKKHLDLAIKLKPEDATLYYLLGRYMMEVAALKWYERKAVATLFEELPTATYEEAIIQLSKAAELNNNWKENKLALAKCHIGLGDYSTAVSLLEDADKIKDSAATTGDDVDGEVKNLLTKYSSYR